MPRRRLEDAVEQLLTLGAGFVLTTVLGGLLGAHLQKRTWDHQNTVRVEEAALAKADETSQRIMQLLDKRLYRMLRLYNACRSGSPLARDKGLVVRRLREYDEVLLEWNDQLNGNLALTGTYFGEGARGWLEVEIYIPVQRVGFDLERMYRATMSGGDDPEAEGRVRLGLNDLNDRIYRLGVFLSGQMLARSVGARAPRPLGHPRSPGEVPGRGIALVSDPTQPPLSGRG
jgi:hypothetical protein